MMAKWSKEGNSYKNTFGITIGIYTDGKTVFDAARHFGATVDVVILHGGEWTYENQDPKPEENTSVAKADSVIKNEGKKEEGNDYQKETVDPIKWKGQLIRQIFKETNIPRLGSSYWPSCYGCYDD
jgi:hypothetical protein